MVRIKVQSDKAIYNNKKIWFIYIDVNPYKEIDMEENENFVIVYVVDNSMGRAIKKAIHYYGRITGIKTLRFRKSHYMTDNMKIHIRRASKIEIVNVRAGLGIKIDGRYKQEIIEVI